MDTAIRRDHSPRTLRRAIALLEHIPDDGSKNSLQGKGIRAIALAHFDRARAVQELRALHRDALRKGEHKIATTARKELTALLPSGRLRSDEYKEIPEITADDSPLDQLVVETEQLAQLNSAGEHRQVLDRATELLFRLDRLPLDVRWRRNQPEWELRELVLLNERRAAIALDDWERAIRAHELLGDSMLNRGADEHTLTIRALDGVELLIQVDRFDQAEEILRDCQQTLEEHDDPDGLRQVLAIRAQVEHQRGRPSEAVLLQQAALRYGYAKDDLTQVARCHHSLGHYLACIDGKVGTAFAHHLGSCNEISYFLEAAFKPVTRADANECALVIPLRPLAAALLAVSVEATVPIWVVGELGLLLRDDEKPAPPASFDKLVDVLEQVPGIRFRQTMHNLVPDPAHRQAALDELLARARGLTDEELVPPDLLVRWAKGIDAVAAAAGGDPDAKSRVDRDLARYARITRRTKLINVLRRIADGRSDLDLFGGLDPHDSAIVQAIFNRLATRRRG